ncbi:L-dopachrome tautomerase-related protein [Chitinophaga pinensis]|uniref:Major royal jelly protein n=1 Tax=Chitinophaga pinensis (strain ATCC 43595 / DSM 2588 / LMG 13176 / NBRC 15968 / NCIMB 11800 / UQM 2034) TaxID=485918 RepID=A0A979G181_CHIPD|nr:L-dopachrome tautomerase-related protein [Chitinophaga pinensis]ACU58930.1 major royal jelly protein [Chitinophaga pinensis DSM 2588]
MKRIIFALFFVVIFITAAKAQLEKVATADMIWNGVTVTADKRIFVCFPRLEGDKGIRIGEVLTDGKIIPYPDAAWNNWQIGKATSQKFVRTNSLRIGPDGLLWIVDTGTPSMGAAPLPDSAAKLVAIDTRTNRVVRIIPLAGVSSKATFIDDLRMIGNTIYLTDAGDPALIVMDKMSGQGRRVLEHHPSTTAEKAIWAAGHIMKDESGQQVHIHADQLEISPGGKWLYFQAASGPLWRVETRFLNSPYPSEKELKSHVTLFYQTLSTGGTAIDATGNIYVSDVNKQQITRISPEGKSQVIVQDKRLSWCDALWIDEEGYLWMPTGQLHLLAPFQQGVSKIKLPVVIYKMKINAKPFSS